MSATKPGRELASPDSRRRPRATRSKPQRVPLFDSDPGSAPGSPAGGTHRVPDPQPAPMPQPDPDPETRPRRGGSPSRGPSAPARDRLRSLWQMTPAQRVAAMRRGELTYEQLAAWSARHPDEVPMVHGEFEWILAKLPEVCE